MFLGQNGTKKTDNIKKHIKNLNGKIIILDFSNEYNDVTDNVFMLDDINLLDSKLNYHEMQAINAGYLADSHCLYKRSIDLIKETDEYKELKAKYNGDTKDEGFLEKLYHISTYNLIDNTLERLQISWDRIETEYGKILNDKIPKKRSKNHISLEEAMEKVTSYDVVRFQSKTMQSEHQRAVAFCLLTRLSYLADEPFYIIADDLSAFLNNGNTKLFFSSLNKKNVKFVYAFNKPSVIPKCIIPTFSLCYFHKLDNNSEIKELVKVFDIAEDDELLKNIRSLKSGNYITYVFEENRKLVQKL